ncbi:uncharacterized protein LOC135309907 [Plodia interpunctella]|uniref:uncharacterized protein LOC135309907 n=1 Tax=Plodia interpunctella TaxID=58824 RepID=UPI0031015A53
MTNKEDICSVLQEMTDLLKKAKVNLKKCPKQRLTKGYIQTRIQSIEEYWSTFKRSHIELVKIIPREQRGALTYFINEDYYTVEDLYHDMLADLKDMLSQFEIVVTSDRMSNPVVSVSTEKQTQVKLPRIELPVFSGNYEEWPTYKDLYISLVHNNSSLTNVQKLHYLKTSITSEAAALLRHIQITDTNYALAWEALQRRYGNKRLIVNSLLKRFFMQKKCSTQTASQLKSLLDTTNEILNSLQNLDITTGSWDPLIVFLVVQKLDPESHKEWEEFALTENREELSKWSDLNKFLESKFRTLELVAPSTAKNTRERAFHVSTESPTSTSEKSCIMCSENHALCRCVKFVQMQLPERSQYVQSNKLCFNCLTPGHAVRKCRNRMSCRKCNRRHHTLLHQPSRDGQSDSAHHSHVEEELSHATEIEPEVAISTHFVSEKSTALLATATVIVNDDRGHITILRALVDNGSQGNFITERAAQLLKLKRIPIKGTITGVGNTKTTVEQMVRIRIQSRYDKEFTLTVDTYVMPTRLTSQLPSNTITINTHTWPHLRGLTLADPSFHSPGRVDMVLGVEVCAQIMKSEILKGPPGSPCAHNTSLGWILFGKVQAHSSETEMIVMHHQCNLDDMLKILWEVDTDTKSILTKEEEECERIYNNTHTRDKTGRYIVKLPFKVDNPQSPEGNTKVGAMKRLLQLERRFKGNEHFREEYTKAINEYNTLKYMEEVKESDIDIPAVYLPHHAVFKESSESTKIRPVFDASHKGTNNISLNDELLVGPQLQDDVRSLVLRWRMKKIAFTADIQKMYLQVLVAREDADYQRILWRNSSNDPIKEYRLLRVTFGTASAPYLAVRTLHQLANDEGTDHEAAAETIKKDFFMDDLMCSKDTVEESVEIAKTVSSILRKGGFVLQKWASNSSEFLKQFNPDELSSHVTMNIKLDGLIKTLGLSWNMGKDELEYHLNLPDLPEVVTKRNILSEVQRLYDPLGWLAAALVPAKLIIQKLWLQKMGWDEEIDPATKEEWLKIRESLKDVNLIKIKRWIGVTDKNENELTIHGYCDASEKAYGAVAYLRVQDENGEYKTNIIAARTKVAPIKALSLPRLELCGAVLLSKLLRQISEAMGIPTNQIFCWTDSTIVLSWLQGDPNRWQTFVRNRIITILDNIGNKWHHIKSQQNPADIASRGILVSELSRFYIQYTGH